MRNPLRFIPRRARQVLYVGYAVVGPCLVYTQAKGWTGTAEYTLYVGLGSALAITAASNATDSPEEP